MFNLPAKALKVIDGIRYACIDYNADAYLYGDLLKHELTGKNHYLSQNVIDIVLVKSDFNTYEFYQTLLNYISINQEIENVNGKYYILSDTYLIRFRIFPSFDPHKNASVISRITMDAVYKNIKTQDILEHDSNCHKDLLNGVVRSFISPSDWDSRDLFAFAKGMASAENSQIHSDLKNKISENSIDRFKESLEITNRDLIVDVLLSHMPGKAIKFFRDYFPDGGKWLFSHLLDLVIELDIAISEDSVPSEVFSDDRLKMVNIYNQFFLHNKTDYETPSNKRNRLTTTFRHLFDSPSLDIKTPYIDRVSVLSSSLFNEPEIVAMGAGDDDDQSVTLFGPNDDPCEYGQCPECDPTTCSPQCCCCHHVDILLESRIRCHKQVVLSCNQDGTSPGPGEDPFPATCDSCRSACDVVLGNRTNGDGTATTCDDLVSIGTSEGWWNLPSIYFPCECDCKSSDGSGNCQLTCVTCGGYFCESESEIRSSDCSYQIDLTPGVGCCGTPALFDITFLLDDSGSMQGEIDSVRDGVIDFVNLAEQQGVVSQLALVAFKNRVLMYGWNNDGTFNGTAEGTPAGPNDFTTNANAFRNTIANITATGGGDELQFRALDLAMNYDNPAPATTKLLFVVTDEPSATPPSRQDVIDKAIATNHIIIYVGPFNGNQEMAYQTNGLAFELTDSTNFTNIFNEIIEVVGIFPSSCQCIDDRPIAVRRNTPDCKCCQEGTSGPDCPDDPFNFSCIDQLPEHCFDIPINKCFPGENCSDTTICNQPILFNACGNTIIIQPNRANMVCCSDVQGGGCTCEDEPPPDGACCGPECHDICSIFGANPNPQAVADFVWCECFTNELFDIDSSTPGCVSCCCPAVDSSPGDPNYPCDGDLWEADNPDHQDLLSRGVCCDCPSANRDDCCNCCLRSQDGQDQIYCRPNVENATLIALEACEEPEEPPPTWEPPNLECDRTDRCIVGEIDTSKELDDQCGQIGVGCTSVRNPDTVVLNNGIGLVSYETLNEDGKSTIKVQQFRTSVGNKILPNREFNFGRLQNNTKWTGSTAKLYYYDEPPQHLINSDETADPSDPTTWKDAIAFKTGPLEKQFFPLAVPALGSDDVGNFIRFYISSGVGLSNPFPSSDDVYNVKYFIFDFEDTGVIGDATDESTDGKDFIIESRARVDEDLMLSPHIYNGEQVPVAYPSIATAYNYDDGLENAHFAYLAYQAFEDNKWNVYLRQLRLSEYEREEQISDALDASQIVSLSDLGVSDVIYRIVCVNDSCTDIGNDRFNIKRTATMEVLLQDGRDVLNPSLTGSWVNLCPGQPSGDFSREKVYVQITHSVVTDRCPDQFGFDEIFFQWETGNEFTVPFQEISGSGLFSLMNVQNDTSVGEGSFDPPITSGGAEVFSASVGAVWYENIVSTTWSALSSSPFEVLGRFKGIEIGDPIPIATNDVGHCTKPVVKVNYNNDVFIVYESTETNTTQVKIIGTATPSSSLPVGIFNAKNPDNLNMLLKPSDFIYSSNITVSDEGTNQLPDMFIDFNDVVHVSWQSNRDNVWEIYYANSETNFMVKRITKYNSKSFKPSIHGDNLGRLFITWHDDRFEDYEIMMAYFPGVRVEPLSQQDPYLAGVRNDGYTHFLNEVPLVLENTTNSSVCFTDLIVDFYSDRTLENREFTVDQKDWPFAFSVPDAENDTTSQTYTEFGVYDGWTETGNCDPYDPYEPNRILISPEFDTTLSGSVISKIIIAFTLEEGQSVSVSFRGSDVANDPLEAGQWTTFAGLTTPGTKIYKNLNLDEVAGRYKQVRISIGGSVCPTIDRITVESMSLHRLCLPSGGTSTAFLDLTPEIRVDKFGDELSEFPIPIGFARNNVYFIKVRGRTDENQLITMPDQFSSVSCESCSGEASTWNLESCSIQIDVSNNTENDRLYNLKVLFYTDVEKTQLATQFTAFQSNPDLRCFTVDNGDSAEVEWDDRGLFIGTGKKKTVTLWPSLSPTAGLLCGIRYYVDVQFCAVDSRGQQSCTEADLKALTSLVWRCNCQSLRWDARFEDAPVNLRESIKWVSSGDGSSDTRMTETIGSNNLNPRIRMRSNLNGVILYESNRPKDALSSPDDIYRIYASVFSIIPASNMYASAAQAISSTFQQLIHRSDIPICADSGCFDSDGNPIEANETIEGKNIAFSLDQYDSIFLAAEKPIDQTQCQDFIKDKQQHIVVHNCGADALDLFGEVEQEEESLDACDPQAIIGKRFQGDFDAQTLKIVRKARVKNEFVEYHTTFNNETVPVVKRCDIKLEVVGTQSAVAIRLRNGSKSWSKWYPMDPEIGENTLEIDWNLTPGSGQKTVSFQAATNAGLSSSGSILILADYNRVDFKVNFYKPLSDTPLPPDEPDLSASEIWTRDNILNSLEDVPVASVRSPELNDETKEIEFKTADWIFIEIVPSIDYMRQFENIDDSEKTSGAANIEPVFDFIQQGGEDQFNLPTIWARNEEGIEVFRGKVQINEDNNGSFQDGLASIIPHFKNDCSDASVITSGNVAEFNKDIHNPIVTGVSEAAVEKTDFWKDERDSLGQIKHAVTIRPNEDPYFIFGDPNYRFKKEDE